MNMDEVTGIHSVIRAACSTEHQEINTLDTVKIMIDLCICSVENGLLLFAMSLT
jgi:hypothetical protein